jgi:acetolactate synthase-1/2/3 large subunit
MTRSALVHKSRAAHAIVAALEQGGVRFVVGMPGGLTAFIWRALYEHPTIRALQVREESIGSIMAEAYGRVTGKPLAVMGQGEWIVGNAGQGILEAALGSSPMIILTEMTDGGPLSHHAPYQSGTGDYGTWNARVALSSVTKRTMVSNTAAQAVQHVQLAIKHSLTGQPGPVAVVFNSTAISDSVGPESIPRIYNTEGYLPSGMRSVDEALLNSARDMLRSAVSISWLTRWKRLSQLRQVAKVCSPKTIRSRWASSASTAGPPLSP